MRLVAAPVIVVGLLFFCTGTASAQEPDDVEVVPDEEEPPLDIGMDPEEPTGDDVPEDGGESVIDEPPVRDQKLAKKLAKGAADFTKKGDKLKKRKKEAEASAEYERALAAYDKSFELWPDAKVLLVTAGLEEKFARWYEAARRYERALAETEIPLDGAGRDKATTRLEAAKMYLGVVVLVIEPEGAEVTFAGEVIGTAPLTGPLLLRPGEYTLTITAEEHIAFETKLLIDAGSESERSFTLDPVPVVVEKPRPPPPPPRPLPLPPAANKLPLLIGLGAAVLFTAGASTTGALAIGKHSTFNDSGSSEAERDAAKSSGKNMALLTDVFTVGALLSAGFTAYYYIKIYKPKATERSRVERLRESDGGNHDEFAGGPKLMLSPSVQAGGAGVVLTGRF